MHVFSKWWRRREVKAMVRQEQQDERFAFGTVLPVLRDENGGLRRRIEQLEGESAMKADTIRDMGAELARRTVALRRRKAGVSSGFTLAEMLVAMALVLIFGVVAVATLRYGTALWRSGHRRAYAYDTATIIFHQVEDDIGAAASQFWYKDADAFDTRVKFWVDYDAPDPNVIKAERQRLRFVRRIPDDTLNPRIRQAGDGKDNDGDGQTDKDQEEFYNLTDDDGDGLVDEDLVPLEGMCEVAYLRGLNQEDSRTLYRAILAPIGRTPGADDAAHTFFDENTFDTPARIGAKAQALAENVLHFEVRCWTQYTTTWDDEAGFQFWPASYQPVTCGPVFQWDSDRLSSGPVFVMDWGQPGCPDTDEDNDGDLNGSDEDYVEDNVFPASIMVVVVTKPPDRLRQLGAASLRTPIDMGDMTIPVTGNLPNYNKAWPYVRIDDEWIRFDGFDPETQTLQVSADGRGRRETEPADHGAGKPVEFGYTFSRVFRNPTGRDCW